MSENESTSQGTEQKSLNENQSSCQAKRLGDTHQENGSDECSITTKESKSALDEREEERNSIENKSVIKDIT